MSSNITAPQTLKIKNKFTEAEDRELKELVNTLGEDNWELISSRMPNRNIRQCHDRWTYYLSPNVNNEPWTEEEDQQIIKLVNQIGVHWVKIAKIHGKRTDVQIKNRWNLLKRKYGLKISHGKVKRSVKASKIKEPKEPKETEKVVEKREKEEKKKHNENETCELDVNKICDEIIFKDIQMDRILTNKEDNNAQDFKQCAFLNPFNPISFDIL